MPPRNSPNVIHELADLSQLDELVVDKRQTQRATAKKSRRNRHYEKQFIRNTLARLAPPEYSAHTNSQIFRESSSTQLQRSS